VKENTSYQIIDSTAVRYYDFTIVSNGEKLIYGTSNLRSSKKVFDKILLEFQSSKNYNGMFKAFEYLNSQLRPKGSIKD
jgi:hypothetical protein